jgi:hypothetical protein
MFRNTEADVELWCGDMVAHSELSSDVRWERFRFIQLYCSGEFHGHCQETSRLKARAAEITPVHRATDSCPAPNGAQCQGKLAGCWSVMYASGSEYSSSTW